jgi:hypothetical protein
VTVQYIAQDMENDRRLYRSSQVTYYAVTLTHEISNEYSPHWNGPSLYDSSDVYSFFAERNGRPPYVDPSNRRLHSEQRSPGIYALVMRVLRRNSQPGPYIFSVLNGPLI